MNKNEKFSEDKLNEEEISKVSGGQMFGAKCSACGKNIPSYTEGKQWGKNPEKPFLCMGYFCNACVEKFRAGEIKDKGLLDKFAQLHN